MDPTLFLLLLVVTLVVLGVIAVASRRRREAALEPTRLGPSWTPSAGEDEGPPEELPEDLERRAASIAERTGLDRATVDVVLSSWREYLAVLGLARLPAGHRYRIYDPYNPPVARRDADGQPTPDRERVARDIGSRTEISERDAGAVLAAAEVAAQPETRS